jgi:hypothetical protein
MPVQWTIRCYVSVHGNDEIGAWYDSQRPTVQAKFVSRLRFLAQTPRAGWRREPFDLLHGECEGLGEIRFSADKVQYRPLGFFSPGMVFTLVLCPTKKGKKFEPKSSCAIALKRKKEIQADVRRSCLCDLPLE